MRFIDKFVFIIKSRMSKFNSFTFTTLVDSQLWFEILCYEVDKNLKFICTLSQDCIKVLQRKFPGSKRVGQFHLHISLSFGIFTMAFRSAFLLCVCLSSLLLILVCLVWNEHILAFLVFFFCLINKGTLSQLSLSTTTATKP